MSRLCSAIRRGRLTDVKRHVSQCTINGPNPGAGSPLLLAYKRGRIDMLSVLLCYRPRIADVVHIFRLAARDGHAGFIKLILAGDEEPGLFSGYGSRELNNALHLAAKSGRHGVVKILLDYGACVDFKDGKNRTPLYHAYTKGHAKVVEALVDRGASIKIHAGGEKLVERAVNEGDFKMVKALLKRGLPDKYDDYEDEGDFDVEGTALHIATAKGQLKTVQVLLKAGFNVDAQNEEGARPIHLALKHAKVLKLLLQNGADVDAHDGNRDTALHIASQDYNLKAVKQLLQYGANVEVSDRKRNSVVGLGLSMMYLPLLELLWDYTDNIDHFCFSAYDNEVLRLLRMTAVEYSCSLQLMPVISALLERGADFEGQALEVCWRRLKEIRIAEQIPEIPDVFEEHFIKLKTARLTADDAYKKRVPLTLDPIQRRKFQETCEAEVSRMKQQRIAKTGRTFYEMLTKSVELCQNQEVVEYFKSLEIEGLRSMFPEYYRLLHVHFREGLERRRLIDDCYPIFPVLFKMYLPAMILDDICRYLTPKDLTALSTVLSDPSKPECLWKKPMEFRPRCCWCPLHL